MNKSTKFNKKKKKKEKRKKASSNILGVFVAFFSLLFSNCLQYRKNRKLIGRNEKGRCNLNPRTQKFDTLCHFSKRTQKIFQPRQGTESGDPGYEDDHDDEEKGVVLSLPRSVIELRRWKRRRWFQKSEPDFGGFLQILVCSESETVRDRVG